MNPGASGNPYEPLEGLGYFSASDTRTVDPDVYSPPGPVRRRWMFEEQIAANLRGTAFLFVLFMLLLAAVGWAVGILTLPGYEWYVMALVLLVGAGWSLYAYLKSDDMVLGFAAAKPVSKADQPMLFNTLEGLCLAAGVRSMPKLYLINDSAPNAFATGRDPDKAAITVTTGLLDKLNRYQLEGVLAHELSHVVNRDVLVSTFAAVLVGCIVLLCDYMREWMWWGSRPGSYRVSRRSRDSGGGVVALVLALVIIVLAPLVAQLLRLAVSRNREYLADANAIKLTRYPQGLAGALEVIAADTEPLEVANKATAHLYIYNPLRDHQGWTNALFSTHPPVEERIARLRQM